MHSGLSHEINAFVFVECASWIFFSQMGNPLYSDDVGKMCYNPAKNFQIGWYDDENGNVITLNPRVDSVWNGTIIGIADYASNTLRRPVVIKIETGTDTDQFIGFNCATGVNSDNDEADNAVTMVETGNNGAGYSQSFLKTSLTTNGLSYTYTNWAGTGDDLVLTMHSKDLSPAPGMAATATITIQLGTVGACVKAVLGEHCRKGSDCCSGKCTTRGRPESRVCLETN